MSNTENTQKQARPTLRLRDDASNERIEPRASPPPPDGPWMSDPRYESPAVGVTKDELRASYNAGQEHRKRKWMEFNPADRRAAIEIESAVVMWPSVDMMRTDGWTDNEIESALEKYYIGAQFYLKPNNIVPPRMQEQFSPDWGLNARGIYYRHHYSPGWATSDHDLWIPSLDDIDWNHPSESSRRSRAETFLEHVLSNEQRKKSEYAWEADAWTDVFGRMRNDPFLAVDKHEYNTMKHESDPVSCLLVGEPKFIKRIPDATFGLATFKPNDNYQNGLAEWDLDNDRLEALLLHRHCGLISDPHWGDAGFAFPFAVYEAKGWSGNAREARQQGCSAGAVYLDMLDSVVRQPGKIGKNNRTYQSAESRSNNQVFVFTSFGAHWHILVGYKRPRHEREYAGYEGFSESVYIFQRIWSGRVVTIRKAWELLSLVDQIHLWGKTDFRNSIIQYLKQWHEFGRRCYANDVDFLARQLKTDKVTQDGVTYQCLPEACLQLPDWTKHLSEETRGKLEKRVVFHFQEAYQRDLLALSDNWPAVIICILGDCGPSVDSPGYPILSKEEMVVHYREIHGEDDETIAVFVRLWEEGNEVGNDNNPLGVRKRKNSGSGEPGPCSKQWSSLSISLKINQYERLQDTKIEIRLTADLPNLEL
ncbi:hypothetical protein BDW59DRAFT_177590 [Aspergillus cavernicola]|uniref:Uncharacterized protein n=1 Tax=Aspergillus cavernicola TaxID=176166 RepID=A0ABR4ISZ3_9EURO